MYKDICTDGSTAHTKSKKDFKAKVYKIAQRIIFTYYMLFREALAAKILQPFVNKVLQDTIKISVINFIKPKLLIPKLFTILFI